MSVKNLSRTYIAKPKEIISEWLLIDAKEQILGRLATRIARFLRGKHKCYYTPNVNCGDNIIVINADQVRLTGKKLHQKIYYRHTGFPGGIKKVRASKLLTSKSPERVLKMAVKRMLPKESPLAREQFKCFYVYAGNNHPHGAQQPTLIQPLK